MKVIKISKDFISDINYLLKCYLRKKDLQIF